MGFHEHVARVTIAEPWPGWHCVEIAPVPAGWAVLCIPHGQVAVRPTHVEAFLAALEHDFGIGPAWVDVATVKQ